MTVYVHTSFYRSSIPPVTFQTTHITYSLNTASGAVLSNTHTPTVGLFVGYILCQPLSLDLTDYFGGDPIDTTTIPQMVYAKLAEGVFCTNSEGAFSGVLNYDFDIYTPGVQDEYENTSQGWKYYVTSLDSYRNLYF